MAKETSRPGFMTKLMLIYVASNLISKSAQIKVNSFKRSFDLKKGSYAETKKDFLKKENWYDLFA